MIPVRLGRGQVNLATGVEFDAIVERMRSLCASLGTPVNKTPEGLEINLLPDSDEGNGILSGLH
jgi:hypothetical protein